MKTMILAAIAAFTLSIGASTMAHAYWNPPAQQHVQEDNGQG
jgi:hypothetical protein